MRIAYVNYGSQSGVTANILRGLVAQGHHVESIDPTSALALRDPDTRLPRPTASVLLSVGASLLRHGPRAAMDHRWNTPFAFDAHSRKAGVLLAALKSPPDIVLQNGALFAPGKPPRNPYVLLLDNTCKLAMHQPPGCEAELGRHIDFGRAWFDRERATYLGARGIATFSERVRQSLIDDYGVPADRVHVVGAGANIPPAEQISRQHDGHTFLFVGKGWFAGKGGPVLLRAFARLRGERREARLVMIGPEEKLPELPGVENLGLQPLAVVEQRMSQSTAFVLPTLREPFGIAFLDAMGQGLPCIGTEVGAVPEILDHGRAGVLVPPGDAGALATAMGALLDDPERAERLSQAGHARVIDRGYQWPEVVKRLEAVLTGNLGKRTAA